MEITLRKFGNSTGFALPPTVLRDMGLKAGQTMSLDASPDGKITLAVKKRYKLSELLAQCNPKAAPPTDIALWDSAKPVGQEIL